MLKKLALALSLTGSIIMTASVQAMSSDNTYDVTYPCTILVDHRHRHHHRFHRHRQHCWEKCWWRFGRKHCRTVCERSR